MRRFRTYTNSHRNLNDISTVQISIITVMFQIECLQYRTKLNV